MKSMKDMKVGRTWGMPWVAAGISCFLLFMPFMVNLYGKWCEAG